MKEKRSGLTKAVFAVGNAGVALFAFKLSGVLSWSWWWILCPIWGLIALGCLAALTAAGAAALTERIKPKSKGGAS